MDQYLKLAAHVLEKGVMKDNRTGIRTKSIFGYQLCFDLKEGFPLLTTKRVHARSIIHELLWFISGSTNIRYLVEQGVRIWNEWPYERYRRSADYAGETLAAFVERIKEDDEFAARYGDLGPVYGAQWRDFNGIDQLKEVLVLLKEDPDSRRMIISAWNPPELKRMALPPCHAFMQFYTSGNDLSLHLYQRSADVFLGVPFNIASYALLLEMVAHVSGYRASTLIHSLGDAHIYENHFAQVEEQLKRTPRKLPTIRLNPRVKDLFDFTYEDIVIENYHPHPAIRGKVAV
ncbi:MAG: thymidylate synthase [Acholeplasmataceae bacterium]